MSKLIGIEKQEIPKVTKVQASAALRSMEEIDPDTISCIEHRVLLRVCEVSEMTDGGIFKPESFFEKELFAKTRAIFIDCGSEAFEDTADRPKEGDTVITTKYAGNVYRDKDNNLYRFANDKDVVAVVKP